VILSGDIFIGARIDDNDDCARPVACIGANIWVFGWTSSAWKEEPDRRRAASFVERVSAERPKLMCSGNLKSMDTVRASCAIPMTAYNVNMAWRGLGGDTLTNACVSSQNRLRSSISRRSRTTLTRPLRRFVTSRVATATAPSSFSFAIVAP
jgi:hypothetical protein